LRWLSSVCSIEVCKVFRLKLHKNTQHVTAAVCMFGISSPSHKRQPPKLAMKAKI